jgi:hypothetical protein
MGVAQYITGVLLATACLAPIGYAAHAARERLLPGWAGSPRWVAEAVLGVALLVVTLELIGIAGALTRLWAVLGCLVSSSLVLAWASHRRVGPKTPVPQASAHGRVDLTVAVVALAAVAAPWLAWTVVAYRHGMPTVDTLDYHMPQAAWFVQTGSVLHLHYFDNGPVTALYPSNSELLHALGLLLFRSDFISPAITLGWAALALAAAWAIGRRWGRGPSCLVAGLIVLGTPALVETQPGGAYNDVTTMALVLSAAAVICNGGFQRGPSVVAAAAAGLALGTKFTMIVPVLSLAVGAAAATPRGRRAGQAGVWAAGLIVCGGFWYLRNAIVARDPVAPLSLHLGPLSFVGPRLLTAPQAVIHYLTDGRAVRRFYLPGLDHALGPAWWAILALAGIGALATLAGRGGASRVLGAVVVLGGVGYLFTPQYLGLPGEPLFFVYNVRYVATPVVLGLVLVPLLAPFRRPRGGAVWLAIAAVVLVATELAPAVWPTGLGSDAFHAPVSGRPALAGAAAAGALLALGLSWVWLRPGKIKLARRLLSTPRRAVGGAGIAIVAVCGWLLADSYARNRYTDTAPLPAIFTWARAIHHARIGIVGFTLEYPLYGVDDSNYVQYIGRATPHAGFAPIGDCRAWRRAVNRGHYEWLVITPVSVTNVKAPELAWTLGAPAVRPVIKERVRNVRPDDPAVLFRVSGRLDPAGCGSSSGSSTIRSASDAGAADIPTSRSTDAVGH